MINELLLLELVVYITVLLMAFKIKNKRKDKHNKKYLKYKPFLYILIILIFLFSSSAFFIGAMLYPSLWILFGGNFLFILYFLSQTFSETRCWKQHRMIYYNFLLIPLLYYISLVLNNTSYNYVVLLIYLYTFIEFQYAKFDIKQTIIWD